jgi:two-component system, OmpR family, phosphate regulon response regulator OmpR
MPIKKYSETFECWTLQAAQHNDTAQTNSRWKMSESPRILIVDDDIEIRSLLERYLKSNGMMVRTAADGVQMDRVMARESIACLVLDLMMPGEDGLSICRRLRAAGDKIPIIMLTARGDDVDRIVGLEMGADDYLGKPFNPRELLARIHAVLRRSQTSSVAGAPTEGGVLHVGESTIDLAARTLSRGGETHRLTTSEFALLQVLASRPGRPLSREQLLDLTQRESLEVSDRSIDLQIHRLRRLLERDPAEPRYIQTVRGHGYVFVPDAGS